MAEDPNQLISPIHQKPPEHEIPPSTEENTSKSTIIVTVVAVIIILAMAFLYYYFTTRPITYSVVPPQVPPAQSTGSLTPSGVLPVKQIISTNVVTFKPPTVLPATQKSGDCFASSIAAPFRQDAYRCMVVNSIYDPCFTTAQKDTVYCQEGIDASTGFLLKLTKDLLKTEVLATTQDNWAWYLKLKDGTECSPFTGTRPFFGNNQVAYYGCKSSNASQQIVLLGDLVEGQVWTASEAIVMQSGTSSTIKSTQQVSIDTVWK